MRRFSTSALVASLAILSTAWAVPAWAAAPRSAGAAIVGQYIVVLQDNHPDPGQFARSRGHAPLFVYADALKGYAAQLPDAAVRALASNPQVKFIQEDRVVQASAQTLPAGIDRCEADLNPTSKIDGFDERVNVDVAVLDTGIQSNHPDLYVVGGVNYAGGKATAWADQNGHGTHVAGTVGALDNGAGVVGVAPGARLWAVRVLDRNGSGTTSTIVAGLDWVKANAATIDVVNMSLGGPGSDDGNCGNTNGDAEHKAICAVVAAGVTVVVAAGNEASNTAGSTPGCYDEVVTVSALADFDGKAGGLGTGSATFSTCTESVDDSLACFSNFGADVDIIAPGVNIYSTTMGSTYGSKSGTSMACPHVAGAAGLIKAVNPTWTPAQVRAALLSSATPLPCATPTGECLDDPDGIQEPALYLAPQIDTHDLAVSTITAPAVALAGSLVSISFVVENQGDFGEQADVTLVDTTTGQVLGTASQSLVAGAGTSLSFTWDTTGVALGAHVIQAQVAGVAGETDLADNASAKTVTLSPPVHDVGVVAVQAPASALVGDVLTVTVPVVNNGTFSETFNVTLSDGAAVIGAQSVSLTAGSGASLTFTWNTAGAGAGSHALVAQADVVAGEVATGDNAASASVSLVQQQALTATVATDKASYVNGNTVTITTTVKVNGVAVSGATVVDTITTANGKILSGSTTTNASGIAVMTYKVSSASHGKGTYQIKSDVSKAGYISATATTSFLVTK